jgi:hypothetical protein
VIAATVAVSAGFEVSFQPGSRDGAGRFMGGTEMRVLAAHGGKLFAGNGYWEDTPGRHSRGTLSSGINPLDDGRAGAGHALPITLMSEVKGRDSNQRSD